MARITPITRCIEHLSVSIQRHRFLRQITVRTTIQRFYIESAIINSTHEDVSPPLTGIKVISMKRKYIIGRGDGGAISFSIVSISIDFSFQSATILIIVGIMGICLFESDEHSFDTRYDLKLK